MSAEVNVFVMREPAEIVDELERHPELPPGSESGSTATA
jgi:hypothetical protein